jgi:hypothetical protein
VQLRTIRVGAASNAGKGGREAISHWRFPRFGNEEVVRIRFGIFYEHQLPKPWQPGDERRLYKDALEQIEIADRVGFDYVWEVEHHLP